MVVVTGATGHIGNVLIRQLLANGEQVKVIIPPAEDIIPINGLKTEIIEGDVRDINSLVTAFIGSDIVYHLAGIISIIAGRDNLLHQVNVVGTQNVINACMQTGVKRLVYISSIHAIAEPPQGTMIDETLPCNPDKVPNGYGISKAQATVSVLKAVEQGLNAVIVHPTGVIGPYDYRISEMGQLIIDFVNNKLKAYIDGAYDFVDVRDVANGIILAGNKGGKGERYILSGEQVSVHQILSILQRISGVQAPSFKIPIWLARIAAKLSPIYYQITQNTPRFTNYSIDVLCSNSQVCSDKARKQLGFTARPIEQSLKDAFFWFKENGDISHG